MLSKNLFDEKTLEVNFISNYLTVTTPLPQYLPYPRFLLDASFVRCIDVMAKLIQKYGSTVLEQKESLLCATNSKAA